MTEVLCGPLWHLHCVSSAGPSLTSQPSCAGQQSTAPVRRLEAGLDKWACWRFELSFQLGPQERCIDYTVSFQDPAGAPDRRCVHPWPLGVFLCSPMYPSIRCTTAKQSLS